MKKGTTMRNMKRFVSAFFVFLMLFSMTSVAVAAEDTSADQNLTVELKMQIVSDAATSGELVQPCGWGGVAPQVTKIEPYALGPWDDGPNRFYFTLKVTGYGHGRAFFDGNPVDESKYDYFINYGTTADGWYHRYLIGPITEEGTYDFTVTIKSIAPPYSEMTYSCQLTFTKKS